MKRFASVPARREALRARWRGLPLGWRAGILAVFAALLLALLAAVFFRERIGRWLWPDPQVEALRVRADAALRVGRLSAADGSGARELYEAALALQPDQVEAQEGLARVALAALEQARMQARAGHDGQARIALRLARELHAPKVGIDELDRSLQAGEAADAGIEPLLARAQAAHAAGRLDGTADAALPLYQRVLALQPRNQAAVEGREDALSDLLQPASASLRRGDLATASDLLQRAEGFDPGHADLPELRAGIARERDRRMQAIQRALAHGRHEAAAGDCLALESADPAAVPELCTGAVLDGVLRAADAAAGDFRFDEAERLLAAARRLQADPDALATLEQHLRQARQGAARLPQAAASPRVRARVAGLLAQAERASARGDWLTPPGESAWDSLREARALAPRDPRVVAALAAMLPAARQCHADGLRDNDLGRAQTCLDAWRQLAPGDAEAVQARRRLADRWLAVGDERLGRGQVDGARAALARARALDPATPGLQAFAERVARAQAGAN